jgi:dihydrolipoamide dehydrogenase
MKEYDLIVIGGGSGMEVAEIALMHGLKVAVVHKPPIGGTCQNFGCIPSKMLIFPADRIMEIKEASKLGVYAEIQQIDFTSIMSRMRQMRKEDQNHEQVSMKQIENFPDMLKRGISFRINDKYYMGLGDYDWSDFKKEIRLAGFFG